MGRCVYRAVIPDDVDEQGIKVSRRLKGIPILGRSLAHVPALDMLRNAQLGECKWQDRVD